MKLALIITLAIGYLFLISCQTGQTIEPTEAKTSSILSKMITSDDPVNYARTHGIKVRNGMIRVVITVAESFSVDAFSSKYSPKDYQKRNNFITAYVLISSIRELCKEPSVIYIRLPVKFNAEGQ